MTTHSKTLTTRAASTHDEPAPHHAGTTGQVRARTSPGIRRRALVATVAAVGLIGPAAMLSAAPASAQSNCSAGTWGGVYGWGDCKGTGKWQLKVSCTWGQSATSSVITGPGHVDVKCPGGSARTASIIYL